LISLDDNYFSSTTSSTKENCFIIFPSDSHVPYIRNVLYIIKQSLNEFKIKPITLSGKIRSSEDYLDKVIELIDKCKFGIIMLDGLRFNVILEMGIMIGREKEIICLQEKQAEINLKSIYPDEPTKEITGLTPGSFDKIINPKVEISIHLSDFGKRHICIYDKNNLEETKHKIIDEISKVLELLVQ